MSTAALIVALISLALAAVAYWRSGGEQEFHRLRDSLRSELEVVQTRQRELVESAAQSLKAAYDRSRRRLAAVGESLRKQKSEALEGLEKQVNLALEQLEALAKQVEESARAAEDRTIAAARRAERAIAARVRRLQVRAILLDTKAKAVRAQRAAANEDFERADELLIEAADHLQDAREALRDEQVYDAQLDSELDAVRGSLREATAALRARAADVQKRLQQVLADSDRIVSTLESRESEATKKSKAA